MLYADIVYTILSLTAAESGVDWSILIHAWNKTSSDNNEVNLTSTEQIRNENLA